MRLVIGQTGAPTAVVNSSVAGFLDASHDHEVLLALGGPDALVSGAFTALAEHPMPDAASRRGGSWLGGGRRAMTPQDIAVVVDHLAAAGVDGLCLVGGNGTMALLEAIADRAGAVGLGLRTVGIPKTIDNDLFGVDHAPGFASAARYLASVVPDMARDHRAMTSVEPVRIVETMGRATGWLALAATLPDPQDAEHVVHRVHIPETALDTTAFLADVRELVSLHGRAFVVVSEGVAPHLTAAPVHATNHTTLIVGGIARHLAELVTRELGLPARGEVVGVVQRCAAALASPTDVRHARTVGEIAARALTDDAAPSAVMVGIDRPDDDHPTTTHPLVPLGDVAGRVREVPQAWRQPDPRDLASFHAWLAPLVSDAPAPEKSPLIPSLEAS